MLHVHRITTQFIDSCEYILYDDDDHRAWLIDCGDYGLVEQWLTEHNKTLVAIFLTHAHCDHSAGVNAALQQWPDLVVYTSANEGLHYLSNEKFNQSRYFMDPYTVPANRCCTLEDGQSLPLCHHYSLTAWHTPGHSPDSLTFSVDTWLFTGDAYIPGLDVVTRVRGGNEGLAQKSTQRILSMIHNDTILCPGHHLA